MNSNKFTKDKLRIIIQDLRDEGILIASPQGEKGYKLPNTMEDVISF